MVVKTEITFPGELKDEPIICNLCKQFDITLNIIEASFSTEVGWAILILHGKDEEIKKAFDFLRGKGITINNITKV